MAIEKLVKQLAASRKLADESKAVCNRIEAEMYEKYGDRLKEANMWYDKACQAESKAYGSLKEKALKIFERDGTKKPHKAVSIGEYTTLDFDNDKAVDWCIDTKMAGALRLDRRVFNKIAKAAKPDFVNISKTPKARIKRDLTEYLD